MAQDITIQLLDPNTFEYQTYSNSDSELIIQSQLDTVFSQGTDYIEYYVYDQNQNLIYPGTTIPLVGYDIRDGDVILDPQKDLENSGYDLGTYNILYNFYRKRLSSDLSQKYFISNISSDRTEIRLDSNVINNDLIISSSNSFIQYRETADYFVDFYLNFGNNQTVIANNIKLETEEGIDPTILIKLYEPLPSNFNIKDELWVVEELSLPQAYELNFPFVPIVEDDFTYIAGPNYNLNVTQETSTGGESFSFNTLLQSDVTSSINQIKNLLNQKEIDINVNYENYSNFVHFSSAKIRLENFYYKVGLIESASNQISGFLNEINSGTINTVSYSSSKAQLTSRIDNVIKNFDGYESFLYFNSGSQFSYPKQNTEPPFVLYSTGSTEVLEWIGNATVGAPYYGGQALSASNYDQDNKNWLYWSIPEYLRDDPANEGYELFVDMVAQYYDNVWVYTKDISNKFDADNRLEYGIAKDLVADAIRDFGVKLYASNFNTNDLFTAFLGLTPSGSTFPFPEITGSVVDGNGDLAIPSGYEYVNTQISSSNDIVPLNDVQKQLYKRIYHNIPYLLKTKGTVAGIRALITSYGIPDTILRISEFGGKDRNESQDWDLKQNVFNYAFDTGENATKYLTSSFTPNNDFIPQTTGQAGYSPGTVQFRFKSAPIPTGPNNQPSPDIRDNQLLWVSDRSTNSFNSLGAAVVLEYTGSGFTTGSYSGSIASPYDTWGTLKFYPDLAYNSDVTCSVFAPFFNEDWWSIQLTYTGSGIGGASSTVSASLFAANKIDGKVGFSGSETKIALDSRSWERSDFAALNLSVNRTINSTVYQPFSGSFQEYRMFAPNVMVSESKFFDYTLNPYSAEGNTVNSTPDELMFRAALGSQLSRDRTLLGIPNIAPTSIHPRVTGSAVQITQSFSNGTSDYFIQLPQSKGEKLYVENKEFIYQDQVPAGIKNRITNKIQTENLILAEAPYGFQTPTSSEATISNTNSDVISPIESIQQHSFVSQSYTPNVNYLEVAFSPSNQINDDINAQLGYFNLGDYIGDPRFISSSLDSYPDLDRLRDAYFEKYIRGYDIVDFIRLIKFFDNSLFKMIKDFTPARTSLASGVVVKQHILERNRQRPAQVTSSLHDYEGLVVNLPKNYSSGSSDFPQYSTQGSALYKFSGGTGGSFERFNGLNTSPSASVFGLSNRFFLTQSWSQSFSSSVINGVNFNQSSSQYISASGGEGKYPGPSVLIKSNQSEFYDGIFSGSYIPVEDGILNPDCGPYLSVADTNIRYNPIFYGFDNALQGATDLADFSNNTNSPLPGDAWIASQIFTELEGLNESRVVLIKLSNVDLGGNLVGDYIFPGTKIEIIFPDSNLPNSRVASEYFVIGVTSNAGNTILTINPFGGDANITGSINGGSEDWTVVEARGNYKIQSTIDANSQNSFKNNQLNSQNQTIFFWGDENGNPILNNPTTDVLNQFNTGSSNITTNAVLDGTGDYFNHGSFNIDRTPNIPLFFSLSFAYSASGLEDPGQYFTQSGVYHSASNNTGHVEPQGFFLSPLQFPANTASYEPSPYITEGLSPVYYTNYNDLIPGGSASWWDSSTAPKPDTTDLAGHPQMIFAGTSSLDWYFPSINFQYRAQPPSVITPTDVSFNSLGSNDAWVFNTFSPYGSTSINTSRKDTDGTVGVKWDWLRTLTTNTWAIYYQILDPQYMQVTGMRALYMYDLVAPTGTNISASCYATATCDGSGGNGINPNLGGLNTQLTDLANFNNTVSTTQGTFTQGYERNLLISTSDPIIANGTGGRYVVEDGSTGVWRFTGSMNNNFAASQNTLGQYTFAVQPWDSINCYKPIVKGTNFPSNLVDYQIKNMRVVLRWTVSNTQAPSQVITFCTDSVPGFGNKNPNNPLTNANPLISGFQGTGTLVNPTITTNTVNLGTSVFGNGAVSVDAQLIRKSGSYDPSSLVQPETIVTQSARISIHLPPGQGSTWLNVNGTFNDSPFLNIKHDFDQGAFIDKGSTRNDEGDIYYIKYKFSKYLPQNTPARGVQPEIRFIGAPNPLNTDEKLIISQSVLNTVTPLELTGSVGVFQGKANDNSALGPPIFQELFLETDDTESIGRVSITGSLNLFNQSYNLNDAFRVNLNVNKNPQFGLDITEYSMSIYNSSSIWSPFNDTSKMSNANLNLEPGNYRVPAVTDFIVETFYGNGVLPFQFAVDCQPLLNNYNTQRPNPYLEDVDYNYQSTTLFYSSSLAPVNIKQIISGSATRATVPVSNYTQFASILNKYNGSKSTSRELNVWNIGDTGTFGKLPTIELRDAYFGYFNDLDDPYPNINGLTRVNLNYLIDEQGNALPPSLNELSIDTFEAVFPNSTLGKIAAKSGESKYKTLGTPSSIERTMQYVSPILYTQNSSNNYSNLIPLSGSGYISQYDNGDENDVLFTRFTARGTASIDTSSPQQYVDYYLNPSEDITYSTQNDFDPYYLDPTRGPAVYYTASTNINPYIIANQDLPSSQIVSLQSSFVTSFVSETRYVRDELRFELHMYSSGSFEGSEWQGEEERPFNLEDIECKVYTDDGRVKNIGSVLGYGWFDMTNIIKYVTVRRRGTIADYLKRWRFKRWIYSKVPVPTGGIKCTVDWEMYETLYDLGLWRSSLYEVKALEWIITANSGKYTIKGDDLINWRIKGGFKPAKSGYRQGYFFPLDYEGSYTAISLQGQGANDYLMSEINTAEAPFWDFGLPTNDSLYNGFDQTVLVMMSPNINEAYGTDFRQGDLPYFPGQSDYFPGGVEPANTAFDPIESTILLQEGDEIRFNNNENYTYKIIKVFSPQENIVNGTARLKIILNGPVDRSINKDFFLVRRPVVNPNSLYLDLPFPYESLASSSISQIIQPTSSFALTESFFTPDASEDGFYTASLSSLEVATTPGILYPDFPTDYLVQSASMIVNDLISKGIIES